MEHGRTFAILLWLAANTCATASCSQDVKPGQEEQDKPLSSEAQSVFSVGRSDGREWETLSQVQSVAFDTGNSLFIVDGQNARVLQFDARGEFVRQFGREGSGPGELRAPHNVAITSSDHIVINDPGNRAFVVFARTGEHIRNVGYPQSPALPTSAFLASASGGVIALTSLYRDDGGTYVAIIHHALGDREPRVIRRLAVEAPRRITVAASGTSPGMTIYRDPEYAVVPRIEVLPDGTIVAQHQPDYILTVLDLAGTEIRQLGRPIRARMVSKEDEDRWHERQAQAQAAQRGAPVVLPYEVPFAEHMSVVTGLRTDPDGRIWIQRRRDDGAKDGFIDVMTGTGRYLGTLPPQPLPDAFGKSGLAAYIERDALGVERVAVRRFIIGSN